jgi:dipeptidyl aminopeptidase/acylaminoacyl peptidase
MERFSPSKNTAAVRAPILLMYSGDRQAGVQSRAMKNAMNEARKRAELLRLPGDDGTLSRAESRIALLTAVDKFLAAHIGN